jgi:probable O-glycosylation ligase (exosortase A-associated)
VKQLLFMLAATLAGTFGVYVVSPYCGVFVYYLFAVLRPQHMWKWSLPEGVTWSYYVALASIGAAVLGMLGVLEVRPNREEEPRQHRLSPAHWCLFAFALWIGVTYVTAHSRRAAEFAFTEYVKIFLMYAVATCLIRTVRQVWGLFAMTGLALAYIAYEINYHYFVNNYLGIYHNGYGGLDNNGAGLMLAMGVPSCWFCYEGLRRWWRFLFLALLPVLVHAVLMTYSRGAMLSLVVMCPFLLLRSRQRVRLSLALAAFVFLAIPVMAGPQIRSRFHTIMDNASDESASSRRQSWAAAWDIALDNPILGVGVRNANLFSHQYGADMEGRTIHSQYLQIAADNGLVGLGLYLSVFASAWLSLRRCRRVVFGRSDPEAHRIVTLANGIECSLAVYAFGSIFLSLEVFELPYLLLLLAAQLPVVCEAAPTQEEADLLTHDPAHAGRDAQLSGAAP